MKKSIFAAITLSAILTISYNAQGQNNHYPRYAGDISILEQDGTIRPVKSTKVKLAITNTLVADIETAPTRTHAADTVCLLIRIPETVRPSNCLSIVKMKKMGKKLIHKFSMIGNQFLDFESEPYEDGLTLIKLIGYEPGEYSIRYYTDVAQLALLNIAQDAILIGLDK